MWRILDFFGLITGVESSVVSRQSVVSCYPNPTGGSLQFAVRSSQEESLVLKIYDLHGREVAVVLDKKLPAGDHTVQWNAEGLPAGIYFYRLSTDNCRLLNTGKLLKW